MTTTWMKTRPSNGQITCLVAFMRTRPVFLQPAELIGCNFAGVIGLLFAHDRSSLCEVLSEFVQFTHEIQTFADGLR